ncbi:ABC transporter substrate-binding protein [Bacillus solitudinis]|uniref:ABC transporter substrate-binding protein n=1 Tax=Bacillus solitudinis TaxID=2014074 RepID=UPI000C24ED63|nr:ABC transporter substrate-binding protein [Bacillus solitudinis]
MSRIEWVSFAVGIIIIFLVGCADTTKQVESHELISSTTDTYEDTLHLAFTWSPGSLDPHGSASWEVMRAGVAETLIRLNERLEPTAWLAREWEQENDTTWLFTLEEDVLFHNGQPMDANSVKESLLRSLEKNQRANELLQIETIEVLSSNQLKIVTKQVNPALISNLADPSTIIVDTTTIDEETSYPALTGAFSIKQFIKDESLVVERFDDYWGEPARLSNITISFISNPNTRLMALQAGEIDGATDIPIDSIELIEKDESLKVLTAPSLRTHMLLYNLHSPFFEEINLRKVVDLSIPRDDIIRSIMKGFGSVANSPFSDVLPFGLVEKTAEGETVDELLENKGWKKNSDGYWEKEGKVFEVTMLTFPQRPELSIIGEVIQNHLMNEGIIVKIHQVENIDDALANNQWDISMYSMLTAHTGDPQYFLNVFYKSSSLSNVSHYSSNIIDEKINKLNTTTESTMRNELAIEAQELINNDLPQSFIVHPVTIFAAKKEVEGFIPHPIEYYYLHSQVEKN